MTGVQTCALPICFPVTIDSVVISGYFVKAGAESYTKIRESDYYGYPRNQEYPDQNETEVV